MREILFRGKRKDDGKWSEGWFCMCPVMRWPLKATITPAKEAEGGRWMQVEVDPDTVGQYTGLQDKNGKRIFEGDIVRMNGNPNDLAEIRFGEFGCVDIELEAKTDRVHGWHYKPLKTDAMSQIEPFCWEFQINDMVIKETWMVVIGNIHDNPELLKGENHGYRTQDTFCSYGERREQDA